MNDEALNRIRKLAARRSEILKLWSRDYKNHIMLEIEMHAINKEIANIHEAQRKKDAYGEDQNQ